MKLTSYEELMLAYLHLLGHQDGVTEIRILNAGIYRGRIVWRSQGIVSGYYDSDHYEKAVQDIRPYNGTGNIYTCLNPAHPDLLARACNRLVPYSRATTGDAEIIRLNWVPIDIDPYRPSGIPATEKELAAALARRDEAVTYLTGILGEGHHICGMSGNGGHGLIRIDLPNDAGARTLVKEIGDGLSQKFSDPHEEGVKIYDPPRVGLDNTVYNPARIWKLPGTMAIKGDSVPELDRIHRRSTINICSVTPADLGGME